MTNRMTSQAGDETRSSLQREVAVIIDVPFHLRGHVWEAGIVRWREGNQNVAHEDEITGKKV